MTELLLVFGTITLSVVISAAFAVISHTGSSARSSKH